MIYCKALGAEFETKELMFTALKESRERLISLKKAAIKTTDECIFQIPKVEATKDENSDPLKFGDKVSNVINTALYLDSHDDVHLMSIWDKSVPEQNGKTYHVVNHDLKIGSVVGYPNEVELSLKDMSWRDLGYSADGITRALMSSTTITDKSNTDAFKAYRDKAPIQHSVRMQYVDLSLAINDPENKEAFAVWLEVRPQIINGEKADELGYFFAVRQAKIYKEVSSVLFGSNDITPSMGRKSTVQEPPKSTPKQPDIDFLAMCNNFKL